jgi:hypothetical protein
MPVSPDCRFFDAFDITKAARNCYTVRIMKTRQKVLFYGNSLVLAGLQASLRACPCFEVIALDGPAAGGELLAPGPSVVIFDLGAVRHEFPLAQMQSQPGVLLIGIDPESHEVLLTGQAAGSIALRQIAEIVQNWQTDPDRPSCAGT